MNAAPKSHELEMDDPLWRACCDGRYSTCGSSDLHELDWSNWWEDNGYIHVRAHTRDEGETWHRVYPKPVKNRHGVRLAVRDGLPFWIFDGTNDDSSPPEFPSSMKTKLRKSEALADWYVIEPHHGTGQPEGTSGEWKSILEAMKKRERESFRRVSVNFDANENAMFRSPRNSSEDDAAVIPASDVDAWISYAEGIVGKNDEPIRSGVDSKTN